MKTTTHAILAALLLSGCATFTLTDKPIEGWPPLEIRHHTEFAEVTGFCWQHASAKSRFLMLTYQVAATGIPFPLGCAWIDLNRGTCDVYYHACADDPANPMKCLANIGAMEHEIQHCLGHDHAGEMQAMFDAWEGERKFKAFQERLEADARRLPELPR